MPVYEVITLGEAYPLEQARVRELYAEYVALGNPGRFAADWIGRLLERADKAAVEQNVCDMIVCYKELKQVQ